MIKSKDSRKVMFFLFNFQEKSYHHYKIPTIVKFSDSQAAGKQELSECDFFL
jgi:hypothetical protein